jgi:FG-GAP repeat
MTNKYKFTCLCLAMSFLAMFSATAVQAIGIQNDFNNDGFDDLVIGVSADDDLKIVNGGKPGTVNILKGSAAGLSASGNQQFNQDSAGIPDTAEPSDQFGSSLGAGDYNNDGRYELVIGVPRESVGAIARSGVVHLLKGPPVARWLPETSFGHRIALASWVQRKPMIYLAIV